MGAINLNKSEDFIKDIKIFNDGKAGVTENVQVRVEAKKATDGAKNPDYKLIASDGKGEINEGFYYQEDDSDGFTKYQAQRLIMLARGVFGEGVQFPVFGSARETLDGIMANVAKEVVGKTYRVVATYGTTKRKSAYLGFRSFGSFIQPMTVPNTLALGPSDSVVRGTPAPATPASTLVEGMSGVEGKNLDWLKE